jgi:predicted transcriptional regulator
MEVPPGPGAEGRLARLAAERGSNIELLARQAIEHLVEYDEWFVGEVEKDLASAGQADC